MKYDVIVSDEAKRLIEKQVHFIAVEKSEPQNAAAWAYDVDSAIASLSSMPTRCALAPENQLTSVTIHMLPVHSHLILFTVNEECRQVDVLSFRAGRQEPVQSLGEE